MVSRLPALALASLLGVGCGASQAAPASPVEHDEPVPQSVRRAEVRMRVVLPPSRDCEEAFDLALYRDRGVDLVEWDDEPGCDGRVIVVRYFPERIDEATLRARIRELADAASDSEAPAKTP